MLGQALRVDKGVVDESAPPIGVGGGCDRTMSLPCRADPAREEKAPARAAVEAFPQDASSGARPVSRRAAASPSPIRPAARTGPRLPVELAAFRGHVAEEVLAAAAERARRLGVGGDTVLVASGCVTAEAATEILAAHLGLRVAEFADVAVPDDVAMVRAVLRTGVLMEPQADGRLHFTMAVEGRELRRLARALKADPSLAGRVRLIAPPVLRRRIMAQAGAALTRAAAGDLLAAEPRASAATLKPARTLFALAAGIAAGVAGALWSSAELVLLVVPALLSLVFLSWTALRLAGCLYAAEAPKPVLPLDDRLLPVYSVLVPLYREAPVVPHLVAALRRLDYPPEKLDIKLVVEEDDAQTRAALAALALPSHMEVVAVPDIGPRTKPKALDVALAFARGSHVCIFDAEDQPEPDQLRRALAAFREGGPEVACVQARLCAENGDESWISSHFAAEYAGHFDVLLPVLSALDLPILLGGTSNHFRRDVLEAVGAWDPHNVTEDADLGIRVARAGWRTRVIASTTFEEAPITGKAWFGQRVRWMKGWVQTMMVHGRHPRALVRDLGVWRTAALAILVAGPFAAALLHPFFLALLCYDLTMGLLGLPCTSLLEVVSAAVTYPSAVAGAVGAAMTAVVGLRRRREAVPWGTIATIPGYWLLASLAVFRALQDLVRRPFYWEKTAHGVSRGRRGLRSSVSARLRPRRKVAWS